MIGTARARELLQERQEHTERPHGHVLLHFYYNHGSGGKPVYLAVLGCWDDLTETFMCVWYNGNTSRSSAWTLRIVTVSYVAHNAFVF